MATISSAPISAASSSRNYAPPPVLALVVEGAPNSHADASGHARPQTRIDPLPPDIGHSVTSASVQLSLQVPEP
jgi:hypothetical protein